MNLRHITRFTYTYTNFQGWRVAINRQGTTLARYFSDKQYGSEEEARDEAIRFRDMLLDELNRAPENTRAILDKYRVQPQKPYPAGLKPGHTRTESEAEEKVAACSIRSNRVMHRILRNVCHRLQLDTASVLKLSLYMFALQYNEQTALADELTDTPALHASARLPEDNAPETTLRRLVTELEYHASRAGLPSFEEFSTGRSTTRPQPPESDTHNTSPPAMQSQSSAPHTSPPRPSPPALFHNKTFLSSTRLAASQPLHHSLQKPTPQPIASSVGTTRQIDHQPKRIARGSAHSNPPPKLL